MNHKNRVLLRYLSSYVAVFVIPVLIIGYFSYSHFLSIITNHFNTSTHNAVTLIKDQLDAKISDAINISSQLSKQELKPQSLNTFNGFYYAAQRMNYASANKFFFNIFYYVREGEYIYSGNGTYRFQFFYDDHLRYAEMERGDFAGMLSDGNDIVIRGAEPVLVNRTYEKSMLSIIVPIPLNSYRPYGTALFVVDEEHIQSMFRSTLNFPGSHTYIFDNQGQVLSAHTDASEPPGETVWNMLKEADRDNRSIRLNDTDYLLTSVRSDSTGWSIVAMIPQSYLFAPVQELRLKATVTLFLALLVGSIIIYAMMHLNYNPIRRLMDISERFAPGAHGGTRGLEMVAQTLQKMGDQNETNRNAVLQHAYLQLINGQETESSLRRLDDIHCPLASPPYYIAILEMEQLPEPEAMPGMMQHIEAALSGIEEKHRVNMADRRRWIWIVSAADAGSADHTAAWNTAISAAKAVCGADITIGIGHAAEHVSALSKSYMQAHTSLQYKTIKGVNRTIDFQEIDNMQPYVDWQPSNHVDIVKIGISEQDIPKLQRVAEDVASHIRGQSPNLFAAKCLVIEMMHTIVREMKHWDPQFKVHCPDVLTLSDYNSMDELSALGKTMIVHAAGQLSQQASAASKKVESIYRYLNDHMFDSGFSVQQLADHLSLSRQHIHAIFKEHAQISINDYIIQQRIARSKLLLSTTDKRIRDIVEEVGYLDFSSYIRKFKEIVGITPGEYRKLYSQFPSSRPDMR